MAKCKVCGEECTENDAIKEKAVYYHYDCFITYKTTRSRTKLSYLNAVELAKELQNESKRLILEKQIKDRFYADLTEEYQVSIPKYFFLKIASIVDGSYKGLYEPISIEDLHFIFKKQRGYLNKVHAMNNSKGKYMDGGQRLNYDLGIVISLYDKYKVWKRQQEVQMISVEKQKEDELSSLKIDYKQVAKQSKNRKEEDILDILDDLY